MISNSATENANVGRREEDSNRDGDSDHAEIPYDRPELQDFDPRMLSPPKVSKFDKVKRRVKAGM